MGQFGLMGTSLPTEDGESDLDWVAYSAAVMELAKVDAPVAITMVSHTSLGTSPPFLFKPINHFQSHSFILTYMATKIEATELLVYQGAWLKNRREVFTNKATMVKFYPSEADMEIAWEAIQIHGSCRYVNEYDVERFFRDAKTLEIVEGTSEIQRLTISREIFKDKMTS